MTVEKIAFVSDEGQNISAHFGRAPKVVVISVEDGREIGRELRDKEAHDQHEHGHDHAHDHTHHQHDHTGKFAAMADCQVLIGRGMGSPALAHAEGMGLRVYLVSQATIDEALQAYLAGTLQHDPRRIHHH